jgi:hypothetical protein
MAQLPPKIWVKVKGHSCDRIAGPGDACCDGLKARETCDPGARRIPDIAPGLSPNGSASSRGRA